MFSKLKKVENKQILMVIFGVSISILYILNGFDNWAETNLEFYPYALGSSINIGGFAGYFSFFPIVMSKIYYLFFSNSDVSWFLFAAICAYIMSIVTTYYIIKGLWGKVPKWILLIILISILSILAHPSGKSLTNISHIAYLPTVLYILASVFSKDFKTSMLAIPRGTLVLLVIASLSKPSFFFILFFIVILLLVKKTYGYVLLTLSFSVLVNIYQIFMFGQGTSKELVENSGDIIALLLSYVIATGSSILFTGTYYNQYGVTETFINFSLIISFSILLFAIIMLIKNKGKNVLVTLLCILVSIFACTTPYVINSFNSGFDVNTIFKSTAYISTYKYKLQYQLVSSPVLLFIFLMLFESTMKPFLKMKYVSEATIILCFLFITNGLFSGIYSGQWQQVHSLKLDKGIYEDYSEPYILAPLPDFDREWREEFGVSWGNGNQYVKYLKHANFNQGSGFEEPNPNPFPEFNKSRIYLVIKEPEITRLDETRYLDFFMNPNVSKEYLINNAKIIFSKFTSLGYRYAEIPSTEENIAMLKNNNLNLIDMETGVNIEEKFINYIISYQ